MPDDKSRPPVRPTRIVSRAPDPGPRIDPGYWIRREPKGTEPVPDAALSRDLAQCEDLIATARRRWKSWGLQWEVQERRWLFFRNGIDDGVKRCGLSGDATLRRQIEVLDAEWQFVCQLCEVAEKSATAKPDQRPTLFETPAITPARDGDGRRLLRSKSEISAGTAQELTSLLIREHKDAENGDWVHGIPGHLSYPQIAGLLTADLRKRIRTLDLEYYRLRPAKDGTFSINYKTVQRVLEPRPRTAAASPSSPIGQSDKRRLNS